MSCYQDICLELPKYARFNQLESLAEGTQAQIPWIQKSA